MSKETEELVGVGLLALFLLFFLSQNGANASATQLAQINAAQNVGIANAASSAVSAIANNAFD